MNRQDVGVLKAGGEADFAVESLGAERRGEMRVEDLECHRPIVPEVLGQVDGGHTAPAQLTLEAVTVGESGLETLLGVGH
jgi:hypothetical protein